VQAPYGPPFALIQGTLGASGTIFEDIPTEACPTIRRGSVAWVESGPEFFISLANHNEWSKAYTVFGFVLPEDMEIVERIAQLPTKPEVWGNINVAVLENPVPLHVRRIKRRAGNQKLYTN
jgi:cyclophilin family peptidyl-prolyl cis-trans isomerase